MNKVMKIMKGVIGFVGIVVLFATISGCAPKKVFICSPQGLARVQQLVRLNNGQWVEFGDQVRVLLPTQRVFQCVSSNFNAKMQPLVLLIATRLACYRTSSVSVGVYTGILPHRQANMALARQRAVAVADILKQYSIGRLVFAKAHATGDRAKCCTNNRIQIETKKLH